MKEIKLRKGNDIKYCPRCKDFVKIKMVEYHGICCNCGTCLMLRDSMSQPCRGCGLRHKEANTLRTSNKELRDALEGFAKSMCIKLVIGENDPASEYCPHCIATEVLKR